MFEQVVALAGAARSGTSWIGLILDSSPDVAYRFQPLFSYAFKDAVNVDSPRSEYTKFFEGMYASSDDFLLQTEHKDAGIHPRFEQNSNQPILVFKTCRYQYVLGRMLQYFENFKLIGLIRDPRGTIDSWLKVPSEFPVGSDPRAEWRFGACKNEGKEEHFFGFYKWREIAHMYLDLYDQFPRRVFIVRYEEFVNDPVVTTKCMFNFLGAHFYEQTVSFLEASHSTHNNSPFSVFKDKSIANCWRTDLDPYIAKEILREVKGTRLGMFLS